MFLFSSLVVSINKKKYQERKKPKEKIERFVERKREKNLFFFFYLKFKFIPPILVKCQNKKKDIFLFFQQQNTFRCKWNKKKTEIWCLFSFFNQYWKHEKDESIFVFYSIYRWLNRVVVLIKFCNRFEWNIYFRSIIWMIRIIKQNKWKR